LPLQSFLPYSLDNAHDCCLGILPGVTGWFFGGFFYRDAFCSFEFAVLAGHLFSGFLCPVFVSTNLTNWLPHTLFVFLGFSFFPGMTIGLPAQQAISTFAV